ncbi:hypothetical protein SBV1_2120009 [Verrucomicrobia bacterium]|nr:hypothetical protein SBV1_2120009 [Verrucomicrobiota bacterium]
MEYWLGARLRCFSLSRGRPERLDPSSSIAEVMALVMDPANPEYKITPHVPKLKDLAWTYGKLSFKRGRHPAADLARSSYHNCRITCAIFFKSSTNRAICSWRVASSGARRIDDGCTVAITCDASGDGTHSPRWRLTRNSRPSSACAAVAPRQTSTSGFTVPSSASSHGRHAATSLAFGFLWICCCPLGSHLKCFTALVTYTSSRSIPACTSALSSSFPAGPTNGFPAKSSSKPGCSPTNTTLASLPPAPNTVWVARSHSGHARQPRAASRSPDNVGCDGTNGAALHRSRVTLNTSLSFTSPQPNCPFPKLKQACCPA